MQGFNIIINICSDFATNDFITAKKTICIKYSEVVILTEHVMLNGNVLSWNTEVNHQPFKLLS